LKNLKIEFIFIDGSTSNRKGLIDSFQSNEMCRVAVMSTIACNMGITLTAATNVIFTELEMNPADIIQAEGRACRIGQKELVQIKFLIVEDSIEHIILKLLGGKEWKTNQLDLVEKDEMIKFSKRSVFISPPNGPTFKMPERKLEPKIKKKRARYPFYKHFSKNKPLFKK
jgi:hypothetical protein